MDRNLVEARGLSVGPDGHEYGRYMVIDIDTGEILLDTVVRADVDKEALLEAMLGVDLDQDRSDRFRVDEELE